MKPLNQVRYKIYTRTGDKGTSALYTGQRFPKTSIYFNVLGTVDELNSNIGHSIAYLNQDKIPKIRIDQLKEIQNNLFDIGAHVATPREKGVDENKLKETAFSLTHTTTLEKWIDEMTAELTPLKGFILPSGGLSATSVHTSRSVCRRCERLMTELYNQGKIDQSVLKYMNRLSDYLFTLARYSAMNTGNKEDIWVKSNI